MSNRTARQTIRVVLDVTVDDDEYGDYYAAPTALVGPALAARIENNVARIAGVKAVSQA